MPLSINVGLSRKASKDYQSTGYSINVVAELDQSLLARPDELQQQIDALYRQAQDALDRQAGTPEPTREPVRRPATNGNGNGYAGRSNGNGRYARNGNGHVNGARGGGNGGGNGGAMTESQRRAIIAIAKRANIDPEAEARDIIGVELDELTLRQASELIDHLKGGEPAGNGR